MDFNIKNFDMNQLYKENEYIVNTYFNSLKEIEKSETKNIVKDVFFNNILYKLYIKDTNGFDILLIPQTPKLLDNDFDDIIKYSGNNDGLHLSILRKNNNFLEIINYDFITNEFGYSVGSYFEEKFEDNDCKLQLESLKFNGHLPTFLYNLNVRKLIDNGYKFNRIKRNNKETKLNKIEGKNLLEAYESFDKNLEIIEDNETPMLKLLEDLNKKKVK